MGNFKPVSPEQEARYQEACDLLDDLISIRSAWIYEEEEGPNPDRTKIEKWLKEKDLYSDIRDGLSISHDAQVEAVFTEFGKQEAEENAAFQAKMRARRGDR